MLCQGDKLMLLVEEDSLKAEDCLELLAEFIITGNISHLFSTDEQMQILNSIRSHVTQAKQTYTRQVAWDYFLRFGAAMKIFRIVCCFDFRNK